MCMNVHTCAHTHTVGLVYSRSGDVIHPQLRCGSGYETKLSTTCSEVIFEMYLLPMCSNQCVGERYKVNICMAIEQE